MSAPTIGSLFTGYGGLDLAVEEVFGATTAWTSDIDPGACKIIAHRFPGVPNLGDITKIDWADVEPVDIITGGYPCQPFSKSGNRKGTNDERHLWPYVREGVRVLRPQLTILENVAGHRSLGFDRVLGDLAGDGMHVRWTSLRAADVGATHSRERVFILVTDPNRERHGPTTTDHRVLGRVGGADEGQAPEWQRPRPVASDRTAPDWGRYRQAVERWERVTGRPAPNPTVSVKDENPAFIEWMMGLPDGWICDVPGITRNEALKAAGNGVVPQQAVAALRLMVSAWNEQVAA